jgi:hypothetical protein
MSISVYSFYAAVALALLASAAAVFCVRGLPIRLWAPHIILGPVMLLSMMLTNVSSTLWALTYIGIGLLALVLNFRTISSGGYSRAMVRMRSHLLLLAIDISFMTIAMVLMPARHHASGSGQTFAHAHSGTVLPGTLYVVATLWIWAIASCIPICLGFLRREGLTMSKPKVPIGQITSSGAMIASMSFMLLG